MLPIGVFGFRKGTLPDLLLAWARALRRPFSTPDVVEAFVIKDAHARMILRRTQAHLRRIAPGRYAEASVYARATDAARRRWRAAAARPRPFRPGTRIERFARWVAGRRTPFGIADITRAAGGNRALALRMLARTMDRGLAVRVGRGVYVGAGVPGSAIAAWRRRRRRRPYRAGSVRDRLIVWSRGRKTPFRVPDAQRALGVGYYPVFKAMSIVRARGYLRRVGRGAYLPSVPHEGRRARR